MPHGLPSTQTLIDGRREAVEQLFEVHDRYTEASIACTIVCDDADLDAALPKLARAAFCKAGQVCTPIQRLYVDASRWPGNGRI